MNLMMMQYPNMNEGTAMASRWPALVRRLKVRFQLQDPIGYLSGKTKIRNAIADELDCSLEQADHLVEEMEQQGYMTYNGYTYSLDKIPETWEILPPKSGH